MDAIALLRQDHEEAFGLMQRLEQAGHGGQGKDPRHTENFNDLQQALIVHAEMEEQVFYPALQQFDETRDWVGEAVEEHRQVEETLRQMAAWAPEQQEFQSRLQELRLSVMHHVQEEDNDIFPQAQRLCDQPQLDEMAQQMLKLKQGRAKGTSAADLRQRLH